MGTGLSEGKEHAICSQLFSPSPNNPLRTAYILYLVYPQYPQYLHIPFGHNQNIFPHPGKPIHASPNTASPQSTHRPARSVRNPKVQIQSQSQSQTSLSSLLSIPTSPSLHFQHPSCYCLQTLAASLPRPAILLRPPAVLPPLPPQRSPCVRPPIERREDRRKHFWGLNGPRSTSTRRHAQADSPPRVASQQQRLRVDADTAPAPSRPPRTVPVTVIPLW